MKNVIKIIVLLAIMYGLKKMVDKEMNKTFREWNDVPYPLL